MFAPFARLWHSAPALLLATGTLLGSTTPLAKLAAGAQIPPLLWAFVVSAGAGGVLGLALLARGEAVPRTGHALRFYAVAAAVSYAVPNTLVFLVTPRLGAGYAGTLFALSPMLTLAFSALMGTGRPGALGLAGLAVAFAGAMLVAATRGEAGQPAGWGWVALGLLVPVCLAAGNVYRTLDWPGGAGPVGLAVGCHLASAAMLLAGLAATGELGSFALLARVPGLALAQVAAAAAMFALFFRLQAVGGPVFLSQIGYVGAAVGLLAGVALLGERYAALTWIGAAVIAAGIAVAAVARRAGR